ncbi:MAG: hypothetical protein ACFFD4_28945 [Candidatus Odinarchaeota archaeon]
MSTKSQKLHLEKNNVPRSLLNSPEKITALRDTGKNTWLSISDSGNNRIIITDCSGNVQLVIGSGKKGHKDGDFNTAEFSNPQDLAYDGEDNLYIADTDNNLVRKANLSVKKVETIAGTGERGSKDDLSDKATFNEPRGITYANNRLFVTDRNNMIRVIHLNQGHVYTLSFKGIEKLEEEITGKTDQNYDERITVPAINASFIENLIINVDFPPNHKLNSRTPSTAWVFNPNPDSSARKMGFFMQEEEKLKRFNISGTYMSYSVNREFNAAFLNVGLRLYYCKEDDERLCYMRQVLFEIPLMGGSLSEDIVLNYSIE